ncbi:hypothetical protein BDV11DRAFT_213258 [Aspergillus similis]
MAMSSANSAEALAIVAHGPLSAGQWKLESVVPRAIKDDEVLVRVVASGICLADVHFGSVAQDGVARDPAIWYPRVLGHEALHARIRGGIRRTSRPAVKSVKVGDTVLLTFLSCGECYNCLDMHPAYCIHCFSCNFHGERGVYTGKDGKNLAIGGASFGQSSFASKAIVKERSVVNITSANVTERELQMLAPLGCVSNRNRGLLSHPDVRPSDEVAVIGVGGVGQSAVMAAAMVGCKTIIAIDRMPSRLRLAESLGATHTIDTSDPTVDLVAEVRKLTGGKGVHVSLDTTGVQDVARKSWEFVRIRGKVLQVGLAGPEATWDISMSDHMNSGKQIIGCVQGDSVPQEYILQLISWFRHGKLPVNKLVGLYPVADYQRALDDMREGRATKPVLVWPTQTSAAGSVLKI